MRFVRNVPGDAKPIVLEADEIFTWSENGQEVFLLSGKVLVQQSAAQIRFQQGIAWVDFKRFQATGILHVDLYAEGQVRLDNSVEIQDGPRAVLDLNTRGEFRVRASRGKVQRQQRASEPIVTRARAVGFGPVRVQQAPVIQTSGQGGPGNVTPATPPASVLPPLPGAMPPPPPPPENGVKQTSYQEPKPSEKSSAPSGLVSVQAIEPAPAPGSPAPFPGLPPSGPPNTLPSPSQNVPGPVKPPIPVPIPPNQQQQRKPDPPTESKRQPDPEPPDTPAPSPVLPAPTSRPENPAPLPPPTPEGPAPLPPPSTPEQPPNPGELPKSSSPDLPLQHQLLPRSGEKLNVQIVDLQGGRQIITVTGGLILNVRNVPKIGIVDVEADRAVIWTKNRDKADRMADDLRRSQGTPADDLEFYVAGHVILRSMLSPRENTILEADELYYDAQRNVSVALQSRLELRTQRFSNNRSARIEEPIIVTSPELFRTGPNTFEINSAQIFSSKLPSDPGFKVLAQNATITNRERPRTFFGQQVFDKNGKPAVIEESILEAKNVVAELDGIPFFYTPYLLTDARDPMGPLETINIGGNRIFGFQLGVGLNVYKLFGLLPIEGTRWRVTADYLSRRGPALGTNYTYQGKLDELADPNDPYETIPAFAGFFRGYGIHDDATDILGGSRPPTTLTFHPPGTRGRAIWRQDVWDLPGGFDVIAQMSLLSDRNFLEQYFNREFNQDVNQANFVYVKQQQDNWAWSALGQVQTSAWITTTQWAPRLDGYLLGQDLFGLFTSNTQVSAGYALLRISNDVPLPLKGAPNPPGYPQAFFPTNSYDNSTGRFAVLQELALPLDLGAFKVSPYLKGALIEYTNALVGDETGRAWGGFGTRASLPLTRLYSEVESELFNLKGLNHKLVVSGNYFYAAHNDPYTNFAELDRLNDDATEEMLRDFRPNEPVFNKRSGVALATSPYFDPQRYAIRRLVDNRIDTLQAVQVLQLDLRQRLQTKRGFPGAEHIVDWMTLDTSVSYFPQSERDNFGKPFSFLEYQYQWNIGDRTAMESTGWYDPQDDGVRVFTIGSFFNRPDRTTFHIGYRQVDPLQSRVVMGSVTYVFSPKYAMTLATSYDFGTQEAQTNTVIFTRTGTDLQVSLGFTYNSLQSNFGAIVEVVPSLIPSLRRGGLTSGALGGLVTR